MFHKLILMEKNISFKESPKKILSFKEYKFIQLINFFKNWETLDIEIYQFQVPIINFSYKSLQSLWKEMKNDIKH
jgi:hypothetical protein